MQILSQYVAGLLIPTFLSIGNYNIYTEMVNKISPFKIERTQKVEDAMVFF
jgi:hypothetical protein